MRKIYIMTTATIALFGITASAGGGLTQSADYNRTAVQSASAQSLCAQTPGAVNQIIYYEFAKSQSAETMTTLQNIANMCSGENSCSNMTLTGHTDTVGSSSMNQALSERRARRVRSELIKLGMPAESISTYGLGETSLFVPTADGVKEALNRRVEVCYNQVGVTYQEPVYQEPVYQEPVYQEPVYQEPVYVEPTPAPAPEPVYVEPTPAPAPAPVAAPTPAPAPAPAPMPVAKAGGFNGLLAIGAIGAAGLAAILLSDDDDTPTSP